MMWLSVYTKQLFDINNFFWQFHLNSLHLGQGLKPMSNVSNQCLKPLPNQCFKPLPNPLFGVPSVLCCNVICPFTFASFQYCTPLNFSVIPQLSGQAPPVDTQRSSDATWHNSLPQGCQDLSGFSLSESVINRRFLLCVSQYVRPGLWYSTRMEGLCFQCCSTTP